MLKRFCKSCMSFIEVLVPKATSYFTSLLVFCSHLWHQKSCKVLFFQQWTGHSYNALIWILRLLSFLIFFLQFSSSSPHKWHLFWKQKQNKQTESYWAGFTIVSPLRRIVEVFKACVYLPFLGLDCEEIIFASSFHSSLFYLLLNSVSQQSRWQIILQYAF